jgi:ATP-binding protein involved in chromosome partitioning
MKHEVESRLKRIYDPELGSDIVSLGMVQGVSLDEGRLDLEIALTVAGCPMRSEILRRVREEFPELKVSIKWGEMSPAMRQETMKRARRAAQERAPGTRVAERTHVVAIASGKGGVGKSTITSDLCHELRVRGYRVGLLDADVWGHSAPILAGESGQRVSGGIVDGEPTIQPLEHDGIQMMSVGFLLDDQDSSLMWRGAMLGKAVEQMLRDVNWDSALDYLVIDMPPGTGDVMMSLARLLSKTQVYIVTNPTDLSSRVAQRMWDASEKSSIKVVGVIENMSYLDVAVNGATLRVEPFGNGGGERLAEHINVPLVSCIPIGDSNLRSCGIKKVADDVERRLPVAGRQGCAADIIKRVEEALGL